MFDSLIYLLRERIKHLILIRLIYNFTDGEKSSLNHDSNPGPLAYRASALLTELLRPDILTDSHTPGNSRAGLHTPPL